MCYIYRQQGGEILDHDVWTREKPSEGGGGAPGGPREGAAHHPMWAELYIRRRQPNSLYRHKPNIA
jgi:hypothetical protein